MSNLKMFALKGDVAWRLYGSSTPFKPFMNATDVELGMTIETVKQKSNGDVSGTIAEDEVGREMTFSATFQSRHKDNLKLYLYANSVEVPASTAPVAFTLPAGEAGDVVELPHGNITATAFGTLVAGTDYLVKSKNGAIEYLGTIAETPGTIEHGTYVDYGIFAADQLELEILLTSEKTGQTYKLYRVKLSPAQAFKLVSDDNNYGTAQLTGTVLANPSAPNSGVLGQFGRARTLVA